MIRGDKRILQSDRHKTFECDLSIHNRFDIEVFDTVTGTTREKAQAFNVITNVWWTNMNQKHMRFIHYGSGTVQPQVTDTTLTSFLGWGELTSPVFGYDDANGVVTYKAQYQMPAGTAVGSTITEVGLSHTNTNAYLHTHALLQDMNGNPISITKTATDVINFYATVFIHYDPSGYDGIRFMPGSWLDKYGIGTGPVGLFPYLVQARSSAVDIIGTATYLLNVSRLGGYNVSAPGATWDHYYGKANGQVSQSDEDAAARTTAVYNSATRTLEASFRFNANECNARGWRYFCLEQGLGNSANYASAYPILLGEIPSEYFPKSRIIDESVGTGDGVTKDYSLTFAYASNATVQIDGSVVTNYTLETLPILLSTASAPIVKYYNTGVLKKIGWAPGLPISGSTNMNLPSQTYLAYENLAPENGFSKVGLYFVSITYNVDMTIDVSDNGYDNWITVANLPSTCQYHAYVDIPEEYQYSKYWRVYNHGASDVVLRPGAAQLITPIRTDNKYLHFDEPPAEGSLITVSYDSATIAKDSDHIFDFKIVFKFNQGEE